MRRHHTKIAGFWREPGHHEITAKFLDIVGHSWRFLEIPGLSPIFALFAVASATLWPARGHFSARCRHNWCGFSPRLPPKAPPLLLPLSLARSPACPPAAEGAMA